MNINPIDGGTFMTILTTGFYAVMVLINGSVGAIQGLAGIAAILAGFSTLAYNCYRFYSDYKKNRISKKE